MPSGLSVESFVGLASRRPQSSCQVGTKRGVRGISDFVKFKLDSYYYALRYAGKIDINVKLLLAAGRGSFICDAI